ncbi:MAG: Response regulator receiver protein [Candidatus Daviesbacteria bacterium GW2011_GWA1_41_61]|uniref:Response regulator receiver protein n=1 Tax=Candidatus Daviesbacteria bacterium GW2011_GWA2_40_9 TaxID=1618424 RepID=A0A0G0X3J6_9BACT|nr:MAG: SC2H12.29, two-component system response regulator [Candidatus Daviesbacteria bacterium GW2011_GWC1_40_9]KKR82167.1 MAG: Response regulator receiver protein [Candidatus Daviesbacteria bacterium GW2011_GWA2_40_9]KKR93641.1 MAG: Response regulator receiver protein [Candidatus Daviesbacteria bacterium GW2011_GWB1_41_15]KKS14808.1 MAG: Response regulator receiver protein [Candidatus Daviesbacteria bacterium GW2011_GWA1_41_61]
MADKKYILVGEDDKFYANIYKIKLAKEGFDVEVVGDGEQVLTSARQKKPDLILLDLIMPVKDGFETLKELKADPKLKDIKVVVSSNLGQEEDIKKTVQLGAVDYLTKANLSIQEVVDKIRGYLK